MRDLNVVLFGYGLLLFGLGSCTTHRTKLNPDVVRNVNSVYERYEAAERKKSPKGGPPEILLRIWGDRPAYVALLKKGPTGGKGPRLVSAVAPGYPNSALVSGVSATVKVAIVIDERGKVEAARIFESSDQQFEASALRAVKKFTFLPALNEDGTPEKHFALIPFKFTLPELRSAGTREG